MEVAGTKLIRETCVVELNQTWTDLEANKRELMQC